MKTNKLLIRALGIIFLAIPWVLLSTAAEKDIDKQTSLRLKEIERIDFRDLPENIDFTNPSRIAFNSKNQLFVTDTRAHNIKIFNAEGQFLKVIGREGKGPGDLNRPSCITFNWKYIIVWELGNYRFSLFNEDGEIIRHFKSKHPAVVWKLKSLGNGQVVFETRQGYCENEKSVLYILDNKLEKGEKFYSHTIKREHYENKIQDDIKIPFGPIVSWDVIGENKIVIGYQEEYKIDVYKPDKEKLFTIEHQSKRVKVTKEDKKEYFSSMVYMTNGQTVQGAPPLIKKYADFPKYKPYYKNTVVTSENYIWVFLYTENNEKNLVDIFDRDGKFAERIEFGKDLGYRPVFADDGTLWTVIEDEEGYNVIAQYKIEGKVFQTQ
ncbi:MAG TPA: 6-bladed beta-propeller [Acidobacteriota bacterium]|nr:6-bladed beta-propeller [Acidobacteriota bacterium]